MKAQTIVLAGVALVAVVVLLLTACRASVQPLHVGDCISSFDSGATTSCEDPHVGNVAAVFEIEGDDFPGKEAALRRVTERCADYAGADIFYPNESTWAKGDRQMGCLTRVGLDLRVDDCIVYASPYLQRLSCSKPHDARVTALIEVPGTIYPGQDALVEFGLQNCPAGSDNLGFPMEDHWSLGFRSISCWHPTTP